MSPDRTPHGRAVSADTAPDPVSPGTARVQGGLERTHTATCASELYREQTSVGLVPLSASVGWKTNGQVHSSPSAAPVGQATAGDQRDGLWFPPPSKPVYDTLLGSGPRRSSYLSGRGSRWDGRGPLATLTQLVRLIKRVKHTMNSALQTLPALKSDITVH